MQDGSATLSRNTAKASCEAFKLVKANLEISYDEEIQEEDILNTRASPPRRSGKKLMYSGPKGSITNQFIKTQNNFSRHKSIYKNTNQFSKNTN